MQMKTFKQTLYCILIAGATGCTQVYSPPAIKGQHNFLVVDGFINIGPDSTTILLSRAVSLSDSQYSRFPETGAQVSVEDNASGSYPLIELSPGTYVTTGLNLNPGDNYRLRISTGNGDQYLSDFVTGHFNPPIDSVSWQQEADGVHLYVNTHDPSNQVKNFRWDFAETWQYWSPDGSDLLYQGNGQISLINPSQQDYTCWNLDNSTGIILESTTGLSQAVVYNEPLTLVPSGSIKMSYLYSILVRQYPLDDPAYQYWVTLQKNQAQVGGIFSPLPAEVGSNIHSLSHPEEPVIGYISAGYVQHQRIFIYNNQLMNWFWQPDCQVKLIQATDLDLYVGMGYMLVSQVGIGSYRVATADCVDCRLLGGTTVKPPFMP
jgi:hypothetical protein